MSRLVAMVAFIEPLACISWRILVGEDDVKIADRSGYVEVAGLVTIGSSPTILRKMIVSINRIEKAIVCVIVSIMSADITSRGLWIELDVKLGCSFFGPYIDSSDWRMP